MGGKETDKRQENCQSDEFGCYVIDARKVYNCDECSHFSRGFLSEPNECGYFKKAYEYFVPDRGVPEWCPLKST